ncbi:hypothetical protein VULLAG_LOCUS21286 [Vulpes lagopus]
MTRRPHGSPGFPGSPFKLLPPFPTPSTLRARALTCARRGTPRPGRAAGLQGSRRIPKSPRIRVVTEGSSPALNKPRTPCEARTPSRRPSPTLGRDRDRRKGEGPPDLVMRRLPMRHGKLIRLVLGRKQPLWRRQGSGCCPGCPGVSSHLGSQEGASGGQDLQTVLCDWYWYCPHLQNHQNALTRAANS